MNKIAWQLNRLPIKWKWMLWSSILFVVLFFIYNGAQYFVINQWLMNQEQDAIRKDMDEIQGYFLEKKSDAEQIASARPFVEKMNKQNQLIRILDSRGSPILTISDGAMDQWVVPQPVTTPQLQSVWHLTDHLLVLRSPLITARFAGTVEIISNLESFDNLNDMILIVMLLGGIMTILLSGFGGLLLSRQLLKPIQSITETMGKIKRNGLQERVPFFDNQDELSYLAKMFNEMMEQLEHSFRQQQRFVEDASHELRTPISIIEGHLSLLNRWGKRDPSILDESLHASSKELNRLKGLVQELLELTRAETITDDDIPQLADPAKIIEQIVNDLTVLHPDFAFRVELDTIPKGFLRIACHHLKQILLILLDNAVKYSVENKMITISANVVQNRQAELHISDHGIGIPNEDIPLVFGRFYRVDKARTRKAGGSGLGLAIAKHIVERYHGKIGIESVENKGTTVTITLPFIPDEMNRVHG